jgi:[CysO sulfur-carrier protein]-S-L-cysteine hydrolase
MQLLVPHEIAQRIVAALIRAGQREIGGILMGEHVGPDCFRVKDVTIQRIGGTFATFVRLVQGIVRPLEEFFRATNHDYTRFNYLGEWHSHHSFALEPSERDHRTMMKIINDQDLGARFVTLLLVRLRDSGGIEYGLSVYTQEKVPFVGEVFQEGAAVK